MLDVGETAPDFQLPGTLGGEIRDFALDDYAGNDIVVLAFYPADFSPTCTEELCSLRDLEVFRLQRDVTILGIGPDTVYSHRAFAREYGLEFPLLADAAGDVAAEYGVLYDEWRGHPRIPKRAVFVVDDRKRIRYAWATDDATETPDVVAVRDAIRDVTDDRTAVTRYADAYERYREGRAAFDAALSAYDDSDWTAAADAFATAVAAFDDAREGFTVAGRFAESERVERVAVRAGDHSDDFRRAAKWFGQSARHYAEGNEEWGEEYRDSARDPFAAARDAEELPEPDDVPRE